MDKLHLNEDSSMSREEVYDKMDELMGQEEVYVGSTYILPNGHFLNPWTNEEEVSEIIGEVTGEHDDFMSFVTEHGLNGEIDLELDCIKFNYTYPYLALPKNRITPEQVNAIKKLLEHNDEFEYDVSGLLERCDDYNYDIESFEFPIEISHPYGTRVFDLAIYSPNDIIKEINKGYMTKSFSNMNDMEEGLFNKDKNLFNIEAYNKDADDWHLLATSSNKENAIEKAKRFFKRCLKGKLIDKEHGNEPFDWIEVWQDSSLVWGKPEDYKQLYANAGIQEEFIPGEHTHERVFESKEDIKKFIDWAGEDLYNRFISQKQRLNGQEKDMYYWMKKDKSELENRLDKLETTKTRKQKDDIAKEGASKLYDDSFWKVYQIYSYEASSKYGENTKWCITSDNLGLRSGKDYFNMYHDNPNLKGIYFYINDDEDKKYALLVYNNKYVIYNEEDVVLPFVENIPEVQGLPDISKIDSRLVDSILKIINKDKNNITKEEIINSIDLSYPSEEHLWNGSYIVNSKDYVYFIYDDGEASYDIKLFTKDELLPEVLDYYNHINANKDEESFSILNENLKEDLTKELLTLEEPQDDVSLSETGIKSMLTNAISNEYSEIDKVNSYITTLNFELPERVDVLEILNSIVNDKTVHVGMYQKAIDLIDTNEVKQSEIIDTGKDRADTLKDLVDNEEEVIVDNKQKENESMKIKIKEKKLTEDLEDEQQQDDLNKICELLGQAHDCIMDALDLAEDVDSEEDYENETIENLKYNLEDLEATLSEYDFMGEDSPVNSLLDKMEE